MSVIDDRGRLFGVLNLIDAGIAAVILAIIVAVGVGYSIFKVPGTPEVTQVQPDTQPVGPAMRLTVRGRNFLPFMRAVVQRSGDSERAIRELNPKAPVDRYALVSASQARFFVESPKVGEVWLSSDIGPGTYDLVFFNETQQVAVKEKAFTLTPAAIPASAPAMVATVRANGAFTRLDAADQRALAAGIKLTSASPGESVELLSVSPAEPDVERLGTGDAMVPVKVENKIMVPASIRVQCSFTGSDCRIGGTVVARNATIQLLAGNRSYPFFIQEIVPDAPPSAVRMATVRVRFVTRREVAVLAEKGDVDNRPVPARDRAPVPATVVAIGAPQAVSGDSLLQAAGDQTFNVKEPLVAVEATLRLPLTQSADGWSYKGQSVKAGGSLSFETAKYTVRGWILSVAADGAGATRTQTP